MALPVNIDDLVNHRKVESARIEYKEGSHYRNRRIGDFLKELDLVEGRNTGVPVIVNVMRENGSPMPIFSSPENRDWLSVTLPVNPHFCEMTCEMESPISQRIAPEIGPKTAGSALSSTGNKVSIPRHIVSVITAEEELALIKTALKKVPPISQIISQRRNAEDIYMRLANIIQSIRRDSAIDLETLSRQLGVTRRTVQQDVKHLKNAGFLRRRGPDYGGSWIVLLDYGDML